MEEQNRQTPLMPQESYGKRMWYLWGPVVIKWAIGIGASMLAMGAFSFLYISQNYEAAMQAMQDQEAMLELYAKIMESFLKYSTLIEGIIAFITIPVIGIWFHRDRVKERVRGVIPNQKAPLWKYAAALFLALALSLGLNNLIIIGNLQTVSEGYEETMAAFYSAPLGIQIAALAVLVPISEELVFRGMLFKRLRERASFLQSALYSAVVFGLFHGNLVQILYGFILGMMLAYVYEKYGSVKAPIAAHMVMNLMSVLVTEFKVMDWLMEDPVRIGAVTVICAAVASTMFVLIQRIEEKPKHPENPGENEHLAAI